MRVQGSGFGVQDCERSRLATHHPPPATRHYSPGRAERLLVWLGERLNPILVKEARQSLKSRQFVITFGLLLLCGWVWSFLGVALMGP